jgi:hypothetical protein
MSCPTPYRYRSPSPVQPPGFDLATDVFGWSLEYKMEGISGNPWYNVPASTKDGYFRTREAAIAHRSAHAIYAAAVCRVRPRRTFRFVRDWCRNTPFAELDAQTRGLPPLPEDVTMTLLPPT